VPEIRHHAPHPHLAQHKRHKCGIEDHIHTVLIFTTMAHLVTLAESQQLPGCIRAQAVLIARGDGWRLPAEALPHATGQICDPRLGAAGRARAWGQFEAREGQLAQDRDHRRLGRQLDRLQRAMDEALAALCDADEVHEAEVLAHVLQHLERKILQVGLAGAWTGRDRL
jgi:hypothetical protein